MLWGKMAANRSIAEGQETYYCGRQSRPSGEIAMKYFEQRTKNSSDSWTTPAEEIELVKSLFRGHILLDPCASPDRKKWFAITNYDGKLTGDGLVDKWFGNVFINPPYSKLKEWSIKGFQEYSRGKAKSQIWLVPGRAMDTQWWDILMLFCRIFAIKNKRIKFEGAKNGAMFPSALCYCGSDADWFAIKASSAGWSVYKRLM
jgi:hypothetical protein